MYLEGGCLCGELRYTIDGELDSEETPCLCHCRICQRSTGAPLVAWATFRQEDFRVTKGEPRIYESTVKGQRSFCGRCGTQLVFQTLGGLNLDITIASLDTPDALQPEAHIWTSSQRAFMNTNDLPSYRSERAGSGGQ